MDSICVLTYLYTVHVFCLAGCVTAEFHDGEPVTSLQIGLCGALVGEWNYFFCEATSTTTTESTTITVQSK